MAEAAEASAPPAPPKSGPGVVTIAIVAFVMSLLAVIAGGYVNAKLHPMPDLKMGKDGLITAVVPVAAAGKEGGEGQSKTAMYYAIDPPLVPTAARTGTVVSAGPLTRSPSTLIWPPAGVKNSTVPRMPAVTA